MNNVFVISAAIVIALASCRTKGGKMVLPEDDIYIPTKEETANYWKEFSREESIRIDMFVDRHKWNVAESGTGLRYLIFEQGEGEIARPGMIATVDFEIRLLDADTTLCYVSEEPVKFLIEQDNVESGLHEGITYMRVGDRAMLILPHYLAHGLVGDEENIPPMSTIIYNIKLLAVENRNNHTN
ncbi:MAG: FKBP-type peptidyl-prolyl cis-trans isomerase [Flavobacteriales bacterium]